MLYAPSGSHGTEANRVETIISSAQPSPTRMLVRNPASRPRNSRSKPTRPPSTPATSVSTPRRLDYSIDTTSVSVVGRFNFSTPSRALAASSATNRSTPCSCESTSVMATIFTLESASARVTCASTPGLFTRKTLNWVCTWVISMAGGGFDRLFLRGLDGQHLIQTCAAKQFHQPGPHAAENQVALLERLELFLHGQQDSDGLR